MVEQLNVVTYNARGLRNRVKRWALFRHIRISYKNAIVVIQESHSRPEMERAWKCEWNGSIFSHMVQKQGRQG